MGSMSKVMQKMQNGETPPDAPPEAVAADNGTVLGPGPGADAAVEDTTTGAASDFTDHVDAATESESMTDAAGQAAFNELMNQESAASVDTADEVPFGSPVATEAAIADDVPNAKKMVDFDAPDPLDPTDETPSGFRPGEPAAPAPAAEPDRAPARAALAADLTQWDASRVDPAVVAFHDRYSAICEQYRSVRARLITMNTTRAAQVIAITSAIPEEGKSVSTVNLSLVMAEGGEHRILLADADFRRSSLARMLGVQSAPGLAEVLRGELDLTKALQPTPFPNLKLLPAGKVPNNAYGELLSGAQIDAVLNQTRSTFDYIFLDTPPITTVSDVCLLAPHCDGAIVVVQMRRTPEPTVQQAVRTLQANNVKIIGTILSRFRERGSGYYEHYYSSYYYR